MLSTICVQLVPLFVVYSIFTFATFVLVHVTAWSVPTCQFSPPFGELTVIADTTPVPLTETLCVVAPALVCVIVPDCTPVTLGLNRAYTAVDATLPPDCVNTTELTNVALSFDT